MSKLGFYNDNMFRAYPFIRDSGADYSAVDAAIVDAGIILGPAIRYSAETDRVFLSSVVRSGNNVIFEFSIDKQCPDPEQPSSFVFQQQTDKPEFFPAVIAPNTLPLALNVLTPPKQPVIVDEIAIYGVDGFLITGNMTPLLDLLAASGNSISLAYQLEPARIQNLYNTCVTSIAIANVRRSVVPACQLPETCVPPFETEPEDEAPPCISFVVDPNSERVIDSVAVQPPPADGCAREDYQLVCKDQLVFAKNYCCGRGEIILVPGANFRVTQATELNLLTFFAGKNPGNETRDETLCEYGGEIPFTEEEAVAFARSDTLTDVEAVPPYWKDAEKEDFQDNKLPLYAIADKEDPTNIELANVKLSEYLSGGPPCKGLITTINGVSGENVNIVAGANIQLSARPAVDDDCRQVLVVKLTETARGNCDGDT